MPATSPGDPAGRADAARFGGIAPDDALWRDRLQNLRSAHAHAGLDARESRAFAEFALDRVSRTFALNIRVLPEPLRAQVLYAYLYCRMADTLEDDAALPASEKARLLAAFADLFDPSLSLAEAAPRFEAF